MKITIITDSYSIFVFGTKVEDDFGEIWEIVYDLNFSVNRGIFPDDADESSCYFKFRLIALN